MASASVRAQCPTKKVSEWNVGCEKCHGPGRAHVERPVASTILNPARFDYVHAMTTCIQCHSQGRPPKNPIEGKYYELAGRFSRRLDLADFWELEEHKLGETSPTFPTGPRIRISCRSTTSSRA